MTIVVMKKDLPAGRKKVSITNTTTTLADGLLFTLGMILFKPAKARSFETFFDNTLIIHLTFVLTLLLTVKPL